EVELECAPLAVQSARVQLADDSGRRARGLARMEERVLRALEARLGLQRGVESLDDSPGMREPALCDRRDAEPLVRQLAVGEVHTRDLQQRDVLGAGIDILPGGLDQARQQ